MIVHHAGAELGRVLEATAATTRLRTLDLRYNALRDATAVALGRALAAQGAGGSLRELELGFNPITSAGAAAFAAAGLRAGASPLEDLGLDCIASFGPDAAAAFGSALGCAGGGAAARLPGRRGLRRLRLDESGIDDACLAELARAGVFRSSSLEFLGVASEASPAAAKKSGRITNKGVLALVRAAARDRFGVDTAVCSGGEPQGVTSVAEGGASSAAAAGASGGGTTTAPSPAAAAAVALPLRLEIEALRLHSSCYDGDCDLTEIETLSARINAGPEHATLRQTIFMISLADWSDGSDSRSDGGLDGGLDGSDEDEEFGHGD